METVKEEEFNLVHPVFVVFWSFRVEGPVEPYDIVGALYDRTKDLVGGDRGLDALIENGDVQSSPTVDVNYDGVKAKGRIYVQTKMGKLRTAKLAATLETIDRIGPYDAEIKTERIKYTKGGRKQLAKLRAKKITRDENLRVTELPSRKTVEPKKVT